jgi:hypothetical protein
MEVEHEVYQGPLEMGALPPEDIEAGPGELDAALEIYDPQILTQFPVGPGGEGELLRLPPGPQHLVIAFVPAHRDAMVRDIGNAEEEIVQLTLGGFQPFV